MSKLEETPDSQDMPDLSDMPQPPDLPLDFEVTCEIELTPDQQRIVKRETGRDMEELILSDDDGLFTCRMSDSTPDDYTVLAIKQAKLLNDYDEEYHAYLEALAAWQAGLNETDPMEELAERASVAMAQEAERIKLFYMKETEACQNAREIAKIAWGKKEEQQG